MTKDQFFSLIIAKEFFTKYCPDIPNYKHKMRGVDGNRKPIDFTAEDKAKMRKAAEKLGGKFKDVKF